MLSIAKAHAFGNDFLLVDAYDFSGISDPLAFARDVCDRHRGIGADGLMVYEMRGADEPGAGERGSPGRIPRG